MQDLLQQINSRFCRDSVKSLCAFFCRHLLCIQAIAQALDSLMAAQIVSIESTDLIRPFCLEFPACFCILRSKAPRKRKFPGHYLLFH